jgi:hypothetical protein
MFQEQRISKNVLYNKGDRNYSEEDKAQNWKHQISNNISLSLSITHTKNAKLLERRAPGNKHTWSHVVLRQYAQRDNVWVRDRKKVSKNLSMTFL